ncbi:DUF2865 domain-containing protein [Mesorhizobium sp. ZMM04-5]|uniref:DUF2865 domain-containing protein n=1 Tax=Mesorhizobium marinum TaxID=3228790 RepID=A0ABV3R4H2_9HYPH
MAARPRWHGARVALAATLIALASAMPQASHASSRVCRQLEAELASGGVRAPAPSRKQEAAIAKQQEQLRLAKREARKAGCSFKIFGGGSKSCAAISQKIDRMQRNLDQLERRRARPAKTNRSRSQIMAALRANGCRDDATAERRLPQALDGPRNFLDQLFGGGIRQRGSIDDLGDPLDSRDGRNVGRAPQAPQGGWVNEGGRIRFVAPPGRYRTVCVRTCDGYFFPMSGSSTPSDFERDQSNCRSSCPGADVQLYYLRPGQESEAMVSGLSGQPYADLPAAWLYRQTGVPSPAGCACSAPGNRQPKNFSIIAGNPPAASEPVEAAPAIPLQSEGSDAVAADEASVSSDGAMESEVETVEPKGGTPAAPAGDRKIRVVGPAFLPAQEGAEGQPAPDQTEVR